MRAATIHSAAAGSVAAHRGSPKCARHQGRLFHTRPSPVTWLWMAAARTVPTHSLVNAMRQPGLDVLSMFNRVGVIVEGDTGGQQQPWLLSSPIAYDFAFAGIVTGSIAVLPEAPIPPQAAVPATAGAFRGLPERIALQARAAAIPLAPRLNFVAPSADVSSGAAQFVGAWGPGHWHGPQGGVFDNIIIAVSRVDADGTAHLTVMQDAWYGHSGGRHTPLVVYNDGKIENGTLTFQSQTNIGAS
jgi:hypothetical protein